MNQNQNNFGQSPQPQEIPGTKGKAIASLVLGICSTVACYWGWLSVVTLALGIIGLVFGVMSTKAIPVGYPNRGMAVAGLVLSIIGTALSGIVFIACVGCAGAVGCASCAAGY